MGFNTLTSEGKTQFCSEYNDLLQTQSLDCTDILNSISQNTDEL